MSDVASICSEFGIAVVPPCRRRPGGTALETGAASTLQRLLSDWGESHLREVLLSIVESAGNERALTAPVIWAVSDLLLAHPNWFGNDWLDALDKIDLSALHESVKAKGCRAPRSHRGSTVRTSEGQAAGHTARALPSVQDRRMAPRRTGVIRRPSDISSSRAAPRSIVASADVSDLSDS
jgi:hypothetical protein